jgi:hypothetical protein
VSGTYEHGESIRSEAATLMATGESDRVSDIRNLCTAFIQSRLANSSQMERAKKKALDMLVQRLEDSEKPDAEPLSINKLMEIVSLISEHTGNDMSTLIAAFSGGKGGPGGKGEGAVNIFLGDAIGARAPPDGAAGRLTGTKGTYKLIDALDSVALAVVKKKHEKDSVAGG